MEQRETIEIARVKSFSDGVFAIAATLLAFNVHLPGTSDQPADTLLAQIEPQIVAFLVSFIVAAIYWRNHNRLFAMLGRVDARINQLNMALLAAVCLMPFATGLIAGFHSSSGALTLYASTIAVIGVISAAQWAYAALNPALLAAHAGRGELWGWFAVACVAPAVFLLSIAIARISVTWAMRSWVLLLIFLPLARRVSRR
jgi:uncharacterized membrane protein